VDSVGKKARFLRQAVRELGLAERVRVRHGRVEALADETGRHAWDASSTWRDTCCAPTAASWP